MTVYLIAELKITDDAWVPEYAARVHDVVARHGGRYLSRSANITTLEGEPPETDVIALIEFPSAEAVQAFAADPDYAPFGAARQAGAINRFRLIDDSDATGGIPYLPSGAGQ